MLQDYDFTVAVGEAREINAPGDYVYYYAGNAGGADATLRVRGRASGLSLRLAPGQAFRLPNGQRETAWIVTPNDKAQALPIVGVLAIGAGDLTDNRITGSVEVVDGGKNRTLAGVVFGARFSSGASVPTAGTKYQIQWWNPTGSGKRMVVQSCMCFSGGASGALVGTSPTALATNMGVVTGNKSAGGAASVMEQRWTMSAANPAGGTTFAQIPSAVRYGESEPIIVPPGYGFHVVALDADVTFGASVHFIQESL